MAFFSKDLDPAFHGAGAKPGVEIWCVENLQLTPLPKSLHGKFYSGNAYLVLNNVLLKNGPPEHDLHYWIGKDANEAESSFVSEKALELDSALGSCTVQYREVQGQETEKFLSYFKPCIIPIEGVYSSQSRNLDGETYKVTMFNCKGDHAVSVKEVPFSRSSLNHNDVFILDTASKIFLFSGCNSSLQERAKALDVVQYVKDNKHGGKCEVAAIEDGKFVGDSDVGEFWSFFGGYAPIPKDSPSGTHTDFIASLSAQLFWINWQGNLCPSDGKSLNKTMLNSDKCYMLDCGAESFVWMGRNTNLTERKTSISAIEGFLRNQGRSTATHLTFLTEGLETSIFRSYFESWPKLEPKLYEEGREKVAAIFKHQGYDVKELPDDEDYQSYIDYQGKLQAWRVSGDELIVVSAQDQIELFSGDCYVIQYTYAADGRKEILFYAWIGRESVPEDRVDVICHMNAIADSTKGDSVLAKVFQDKEPLQFFSILQRVIIFKGGLSKRYKELRAEEEILDETCDVEITALYRVQGTSPNNMQAVQVDKASSSLNSSYCYILKTGNATYSWIGNLSSTTDHDLLDRMLELINPTWQPTILREGSEPDIFWETLGGKTEYPREKEIRQFNEEPHLFTFTLTDDDFKVKEIYSFTQDYLTTEDVLILNCHEEIYIWVGCHSNVKYKHEAFTIGQKFLQTIHLVEGIFLETPIYVVTEGQEPPFFTRFFEWDPSKAYMHGNSFERKLAIVKGNKQSLENFKVIENFHCVDPIGLSGGIWLLWKNSSIHIDILKEDHYFIHFRVKRAGCPSFTMTLVYASTIASLRNAMWEDIASLPIDQGEPWIVSGDFNDITKMSYQQGGSQQYITRCVNHQNQINAANLIDMGASGNCFTWRRNRLQVRLDRVYTNSSGRCIFPNATVNNLPFRHSDHCPILLMMEDPRYDTTNRPFRYEVAWDSHEGFLELVEKSWRPQSNYPHAAENFKKEVVIWNKRVFGHISQRKRRLLARIAGINKELESNWSHSLQMLDTQVRTELLNVLNQEEIFWHQKSRRQWLTDGDRNTRYFHISTRRKRNRIDRLKSANGEWIEDQGKLKEMVVQHFQNLFSMETRSAMGITLAGRFPTLENNVYESAFKQLSSMDVEKAIFEMGALKAPGIDGLPAGFFQKHWKTVKTGVIEYILNTFEGRTDIAGINETILTLIPKVSHPESVNQFRPISLCNVIYKVITKMIANRIKSILPLLVGPNQSSFVPGRQISDNIIIAQEIIHSMRVRKGKKGFVAVKIDLEKAYDRLRWDFIVDTLNSCGVLSQWVNMVHKCISTSSMRIMFNGSMPDSFKPSSGIRQGDPLSPYLFVLCMERLGQIIQSKVDAGVWKGIKCSRNSPTITHLFFADDLFLFSEASIDQIEVMKSCLSDFCAMSGQCVSVVKSRLCVSKNVSSVIARALSQRSGIPLTSCLGKYLGVPLLHKRVTKSTFAEVVGNVQNKLSGWKASSLSRAGRATLIKSVSSSIPNHVMQTNLLPSCTLDLLDKVNRNFLWGSENNQRKTHLVTWEQVCNSQSNGGIGLRKSDFHNSALLMKLLWRMSIEPDALWVQLLKGKYLVRSDMFNIEESKARKSHLWRSLLKILPNFKNGLAWAPKKGNNVRFWKDTWLIGKPLVDYLESIPEDQKNRMVNEYIDESGNWDWSSLESMLPYDILLHLAAYKIDRESGEEDTITWNLSPSGEFTTKSAFSMLTTSGEPFSPLLDLIWKLKIPHRIQFHTWLAAQEKLLSNTERKRRHMIDYDNCTLCITRSESVIHILRDCVYSFEFWRKIDVTRIMPSFFTAQGDNWWQLNLQCTCCIACWCLRKWRNLRIFRNGDNIPSDKYVAIKRIVDEYRVCWSPSYLLRAQEMKEMLTSWRKPSDGWFKLNVDGSCKLQTRSIGAGGLIRDHNGTWQVGCTHNIGKGHSLVAEAWAALTGLKLTAARGISNVILESDSSELVNILNKTQLIGPCHPLRNIVNCILHYLSLMNQFRVVHCYREANACADHLANLAHLTSVGVNILECPPSSIHHLLYMDSCGSVFPRRVPALLSI